MFIQTERLILREFEAADGPAVLAYQNDPRYLKYYPWEDRTEADARAFVQRFLDQQMEAPRHRFQLVIALPGGHTAIGNCGMRRNPENDRDAEIGYELNPEFWGRGYATEAAAAIIDFGFREWDLHRISSWCVADNSPSVRVLERLGLQQEGRLRETLHFKGRWWDQLLYGLLKTQRAGFTSVVQD